MQWGLKPPITLVTLHAFVLTAPKLPTENSLKYSQIAKDTNTAIVRMSFWDALRKPSTFPIPYSKQQDLSQTSEELKISVPLYLHDFSPLLRFLCPYDPSWGHTSFLNFNDKDAKRLNILLGVTATVTGSPYWPCSPQNKNGPGKYVHVLPAMLRPASSYLKRWRSVLIKVLLLVCLQPAHGMAKHLASLPVKQHSSCNQRQRIPGQL